jgi:hypothetical protein
MFLILASRYDKMARELLSYWREYDFQLLTPRDLSNTGWVLNLKEPWKSTTAIGMQQFSIENITGVLTLLPYVTEDELTHIRSDDRQYVAAEMTAFLVCWLSILQCPILNRPTPTCLSGPNWRWRQWVSAAAKIGIQIHPASWNACSSNEIIQCLDNPNPTTVTIVGGRCFGSADDTLKVQSLLFAREAGVDLLSVKFSGTTRESFFIDATPWLYFISDDVANAILEYLTGKKAV